jgi:hypothetical protein
MWDGEPVEDFLFLLCSDAIVLVEEVEEFGFRLFQRSVSSGFEVAEVGEDALFEFLCVADRSAECKEAVCEGADDICAGDVKEVVPIVRLSNRKTHHRTQETYSPDGNW